MQVRSNNSNYKPSFGMALKVKNSAKLILSNSTLHELTKAQPELEELAKDVNIAIKGRGPDKGLTFSDLVVTVTGVFDKWYNLLPIKG